MPPIVDACSLASELPVEPLSASCPHPTEVPYLNRAREPQNRCFESPERQERLMSTIQGTALGDPLKKLSDVHDTILTGIDVHNWRQSRPGCK